MAEIIPQLPSDMKVAVIRDQSEFIETSLHAIEEHLVLGAIFAAIIVFIFLWNFRSTFIAALAIPVSIIAAFAAIAGFRFLAQPDDDACADSDGGHRDRRRDRCSRETYIATLKRKAWNPSRPPFAGTKDIGLAVLATTLSLLAVFIPVGFMTGIVGRFMSSFGLTACGRLSRCH
jgi:HAE1 family hydrophobic/amphiphilic exporter-1